MEPSVTFRLPATWNLNSPELAIDRKDLAEFKGLVKTRFSVDSFGLDYLESSYQCRKTEGSVRLHSSAVTEPFHSELPPQFYSDTANACIKIAFKRQESAAAWASRDYLEKLEHSNAIGRTLSAEIIETRVSRLPTYTFDRIDATILSAPIIYRVLYLQVGEDSLRFVARFHANMPEDLVTETSTILRRIDRIEHESTFFRK